MRRARGWGGLPSLLLNSHIAEFILAVLGYVHIGTSQSEQEYGDHCGKNEHCATPFFCILFNITIFFAKSYSPFSTVMD